MTWKAATPGRLAAMQRPKKRSRPELKIQAQIIAALKLLAPKYDVRAGMEGFAKPTHPMFEAGMKKGWPDLNIVGPDKFSAWMEVKAPGGEETLEQQGQMAWLEKCGFPVVTVWSLDEALAACKKWGIL